MLFHATLGWARFAGIVLIVPGVALLNDLLRKYVPLRIESSDPSQLEADYARSEEIHRQL